MIELDVYAYSGDMEAGQLTAYSPHVSEGIGTLMPQLDPSFSGGPTPERRLERMIASPDIAQLIVVQDRLTVVGAATVGLVMGAGFGERGQLEDVIVDERVRGQRNESGESAADLLWKSVVGWHALQGLSKIGFDSELNRTAARRFYMKKGAVVPDMENAPSHFEYVLTEEDKA